MSENLKNGGKYGIVNRLIKFTITILFFFLILSRKLNYMVKFEL